MIPISVHVEVTTLVAYLFDTCTGAVKKTINGGRARLTVNGKRGKACNIVLKASVDLSRIQPTLTDEEKEKFYEALSTIEGYFQALAEPKGRTQKRQLTSELIIQARAYKDMVTTTSTLKMAKLAIEGRDSPAYKLFKKYGKNNMDPTEVIQYIKEQLQGQSASNNQEAKLQTAPKEPSHRPQHDQHELADAVMDGLEKMTDVESNMDVDPGSMSDVESFMSCVDADID